MRSYDIPNPQIEKDECTETHFIFPTAIGIGKLPVEKRKQYRTDFLKAVEVDKDHMEMNDRCEQLQHTKLDTIKAKNGTWSSPGIIEHLMPMINDLTTAVKAWGNKVNGWMYDDPDWFCTSAWHNHSIKGGWQYKHSHANSVLTMTYYMNLLPDQPVTTLYRPDHHTNPYISRVVGDDEYNPANTYTIDPVLEQDNYLIFPSYIDHEVAPNRRDEPRVTLALNFVPENMGGHRYPLEFKR